MQAINFVIRTPMGGTQSGVVSGEVGSNTVFMQSNEEISLHLARHQVSGYQRDGGDLIITLVDGRQITLSGYFNAEGEAENRLFISSDGTITEVNLLQSGENEYFAQYGTQESWGKWSPDEQMVFYDEAAPVAVADAPVAAYEDETVSMLGAGAILAPILSGGGGGGAAAVAAGLVGGAAIIGGGSGGGSGGGGGSTSSKAPATVANANGTVTIGGDGVEEKDEVVTITGTGEPGASVEVNINGNTETTTVDKDGNWTVDFVGPTYPGDGNHEVDVTVTDPDGEVTELTGPDVVIDTTPPELEFSSGVVSTSDNHNQEGYTNSGVTISGKGEAGATVEVTVENVTHTTTVKEDGTWSVTYDKTELEGGDYTTDVTVVTTDSFGNSQTYTDVVDIDTVINAGVNGNLSGGDNTVNLTESGGAVAITGTGDAFSAITLAVVDASGATLGTYTTTTDENGNWTVDVPQGILPTGETSVGLNVTAVDGAGNATSTSGTMDIDTIGRVDVAAEKVEGDGTLNFGELEDGSFTVTGTAEAGTTKVDVTVGTTTLPATVNPDGSWSVNFNAAAVGSGEKDVQVTATATDGAGNVSTSSDWLHVDTYVNKLNVTDDSTGIDTWVNKDELSSGLRLSGQVEDGAQSVTIEHNGSFYPAKIDPPGTWSVTIPKSAVGQGAFDYTVHAVDGAGNTDQIEQSVNIDTLGSVSVAGDQVEGDGVLNGQELSDGRFTVTGASEPGTTAVNVTIGMMTLPATVNPDGTWSVQFPQSAAGSTERDVMITAEATDRAGNVSTNTDWVRVDPYVNELSVTDDSTGSDAWVNTSELANGLALSGRVEAGPQSVKIEHNNVLYDATFDANGNWSIVLPKSIVNQGAFEYSVHAVDGAGNQRELADQSVMIDTIAPDGPTIFEEGTRIEEGTSDVYLTRLYLQNTGDELDLYTISDTGTVDRPEQRDTFESAAWSASGKDEVLITLANSEKVMDGTTLVVTSSDDAGNTTGNLLAWDQTGSLNVNMDHVVASGLNVETVDLRLAKNADLTLTADQIRDLSENNDQVTVYGGSDDSVTITGAQFVETYTDATGHNFSVYDLGDTRVLVDEDITNVNTSVI